MISYLNLSRLRRKKTWRRLISFGDCNEGTTAVEIAIILPVFFALLFGIIEGGLLFYTQSTLQFAVEAAARCAAVDANTCSSPSTIQAYAASQASGMSVSSSSFTVSSPSCGQQVSISYPFNSIVPGLIPWTITLNVQSCHP